MYIVNMDFAEREREREREKERYNLFNYALHDHHYYRVYPDILSLVGDPLSGNGCGSPNHT